MRILHLVQGYAPAIGGSEFLIQNISERLASSHNDDVTVFTTTSYNTEGFVNPRAPQMPPGESDINGVAVKRFAVINWPAPCLRYAQYAAYRLRLPGNGRLRTFYNGPFSPSLHKAVRQGGFDVVAASSFPLLHMQYALSALPKTPVVLIGGLHPEDAWGFNRRDIYKAIKKASRYVAYTDFERDYVVGLGIEPEKVAVIGAGIDPAAYAAVTGPGFRSEHGLDGVPLVAFIGQQGGHKGIEHIILAMRRIWPRMPDAALVIAGAHTSYTPKIKKEIARLPETWRRRVIHLESVSHGDKCKILADCDVFASPSGFESFGITYLEAWIYGKPVIGTRSGAIPTVISDGVDGFLCDYGCADELAGILLELFTDSGARHRLGEAGRAKVLVKYTWEIVTDQLRLVYKSLAEGGK